VGAGRAGPCHGDVWQRRQVVQGVTGVVQGAADVPIARAAVDRHRVHRRIDLEHARQPPERDEVAVRVPEVVERVAGADGAHPGGGSHERPDLRQGLRLEDPARSVRVIARPVPHHGVSLPDRADPLPAHPRTDPLAPSRRRR
jgi:hypothetical protein